MTLPHTESLSPFVMTEWPEEGRDEIVEDFTDLLETLTDREQDPTQVEENLDRVLSSPTSHLVVVQEGSQIISTATLSSAPILTGSGQKLWIDDVVTLPTYQGQGHSKRVMNAMEEMATSEGDEVYLTSSDHRDRARQGYERRGYQLLNDYEWPKVVWRNAALGDIALDPEIEVTPVTSLRYSELHDVAELLDEDYRVVRDNLRGVLESPSTTLFVARQERIITGVAVANETPIPVGKKPWIDNIAGEEVQARHAVINAAAAWIGTRYKHANIVAAPDADLPAGFQKRETGLYVKVLGRGALAGIRE